MVFVCAGKTSGDWEREAAGGDGDEGVADHLLGSGLVVFQAVERVDWHVVDVDECVFVRRADDKLAIGGPVAKAELGGDFADGVADAVADRRRHRAGCLVAW